MKCKVKLLQGLLGTSAHTIIVGRLGSSLEMSVWHGSL